MGSMMWALVLLVALSIARPFGSWVVVRAFVLRQDQHERVLAQTASESLSSSRASSSAPGVATCPTPHAGLGDPFAGPHWNGWGADLANTRFQSSRAAGLTAEQVPKLQLKWAFGFPDATSAHAQPTIAAGRVFVGSQPGVVYALDAKSGCTYWSFAAQAGVRSAISIGRLGGPGAARYAVYFGDLRANAYALDAQTGELMWKTNLDDHASARVTGAPVWHDGRLYVPVSSVEEVPGAMPNYECCRFRGSVVALNATTGQPIWKSYTIPEASQPVRKNAAGTQLWAPAGAAIWSAPTMDATRGLIYVGTGNAYTEPAAKTSDAILALELGTGKARWVQQVTPGDAFLIGCRSGSENCPEQLGPDYDFGSSPILRTLPGGRRILVVGQKSGVVYGLDPDREGAIVWQFRAGKGGALGGIEWGSAADEHNVYVPVSDVLGPPQEAGGLFALRLDTGERVWHTPAPKLSCTGGRGCTGAQSAAVTAIPGVVFSGSIDGHLRAYATVDGRIVWEFQTVRSYETVNGVAAKGGSIDAAGPTVAGGMLFTNSGYGQWRGLAGNVLLAFGVQ